MAAPHESIVLDYARDTVNSPDACLDTQAAARRYLADRDPVGLTEYKVLENYIPYDMSGKQLKLAPKEDKTNA